MDLLASLYLLSHVAFKEPNLHLDIPYQPSKQTIELQKKDHLFNYNLKHKWGIPHKLEDILDDAQKLFEIGQKIYHEETLDFFDADEVTRLHEYYFESNKKVVVKLISAPTYIDIDYSESTARNLNPVFYLNDAFSQRISEELDPDQRDYKLSLVAIHLKRPLRSYSTIPLFEGFVLDPHKVDEEISKVIVMQDNKPIMLPEK